MSSERHVCLVLEIENDMSCAIRRDMAVLGRRAGQLAVVQDENDETLCPVQRGDWVSTLSRRHARIRYHDGTYYLEDLRSKNGTFWNNLPLRPFEPVRLSEGDQVRFGALQVQVRIVSRDSEKRSQEGPENCEGVAGGQKGA